MTTLWPCEAKLPPTHWLLPLQQLQQRPPHQHLPCWRNGICPTELHMAGHFLDFCSWHLGVSINGGPPKCFFLKWKIPSKWMIWGTPISGSHHFGTTTHQNPSPSQSCESTNPHCLKHPLVMSFLMAICLESTIHYFQMQSYTWTYIYIYHVHTHTYCYL